MMKDYTELKRLCKQVGCFCPEEHIVRVAIANTPLWLRLYFEKINQEAAKGVLGERIRKIMPKSKESDKNPPRKSLKVKRIKCKDNSEIIMGSFGKE